MIAQVQIDACICLLSARRVTSDYADMLDAGAP